MSPARRQNSIETLALVAKAGSRYVYAGWDHAGQPVLSTSKDDLAPEASSTLQFFVKSGYPIPKLQLTNGELSVAIASIVGAVQDLKDVSQRELVQDTIQITIINESGSQETVTLGELEALRMIGDGLLTFQFLGTVLDTEDRQEAVNVFSLFLPGDYEESRPDLILLIKPTNINIGNAIDTVLFVSDIVKKLIANDRKQPSKMRKGYLEAEVEAEKAIEREAASNGGLLDFFLEPAFKEKSKTGLKNLVSDFFTTTPGQPASNFFLVPVEKQEQFTEGSVDNLLLLRTIATKMYMYARKRINVS